MSSSGNYVIYNKGQGGGYLESNTDITKEFEPKEIEFVFGTIKPGEPTDLGGYFGLKKPVYCGIKGNEMLFFLGEYDTWFFYISIHYINESRIYIQFSYQAGRDFNYKENKWK